MPIFSVFIFQNSNIRIKKSVPLKKFSHENFNEKNCLHILIRGLPYGNTYFITDKKVNMRNINDAARLGMYVLVSNNKQIFIIMQFYL